MSNFRSRDGFSLLVSLTLLLVIDYVSKLVWTNVQVTNIRRWHAVAASSTLSVGAGRPFANNR
jgi:hypothetical protein